jgi:predicted HicB family RNase H-like nuclease
VIAYDPDISMLRGAFVGLNGGADFYANDVAGLVTEGAASLREFLEVCREQGIEPYRNFSGRLNVRLDDLHEAAAVAAAPEGVSLNQYIVDAVRERVQHAA